MKLIARLFLSPGLHADALDGTLAPDVLDGEDDAPDRVELDVRQWWLAPQIGHRWVLARVPLAFVVRGSVGYGPYHVRARTDGAVAQDAARFARDVMNPTPVTFDLELSIAYAF